MHTFPSFFHSHFIPSVGEKAGTNFAYYDKIDQLIDAARIEIHLEKQIHLWSQAQIRILNDMAALPIMYSTSNVCPKSLALIMGIPSNRAWHCILSSQKKPVL